jgi:hypothetical protein
MDKMGKEIIVEKYTIVSRNNDDREFCIVEPAGFFANWGLFYYSPEETKKHYKHNQRMKKENKYFKPYTRQLIGCNDEIKNKKVYRRLINAYIKGEICDN